MRITVELDSDDSCDIAEGDRHDLRDNPRLIEHIEPARSYPALRSFLVNVNAADSPFATFGCKSWSEIETGATEEHIFVSRVDLNFLRPFDNRVQGPLTDVAHRLGQLLAHESDALSANLRVVPVQRSAEQAGYCLRLFLYARGSTLKQAEVRWALGLAHVQQALLFVARELR